MTLSISILIGSAITLVILAGVFRLEESKGRLVLLPGLRAGFNYLLNSFYSRLHNWHPYLGQGFVRLILHYVMHGILRRLLNVVRFIERAVERLMRQNRQVAKTIDAEKRQASHLEAIAEHKVETALSEREKQRRRAEKV